MATQYPTEHEDFQLEVEKLRKRNEELVVEVMRQSARASEAEEELKHWRVELEIFDNQRGHNLCWMNDIRLIQNTIGHDKHFQGHGSPPPREEFLLGCRVYCEDYYRSRFEKVIPRVDEPQI